MVAVAVIHRAVAVKRFVIVMIVPAFPMPPNQIPNQPNHDNYCRTSCDSRWLPLQRSVTPSLNRAAYCNWSNVYGCLMLFRRYFRRRRRDYCCDCDATVSLLMLYVVVLPICRPSCHLWRRSNGDDADMWQSDALTCDCLNGWQRWLPLLPPTNVFDAADAAETVDDDIAAVDVVVANAAADAGDVDDALNMYYRQAVDWRSLADDLTMHTMW